MILGRKTPCTKTAKCSWKIFISLDKRFVRKKKIQLLYAPKQRKTLLYCAAFIKLTKQEYCIKFPILFFQTRASGIIYLFRPFLLPITIWQRNTITFLIMQRETFPLIFSLNPFPTSELVKSIFPLWYSLKRR